MEIKRTNSLQVEGIEPNVNNHSNNTLEKHAVRSELGTSMIFSNRTRIPQFLQQTLRQSRGL
jgi:hypothetical protein